MPLEPTVKRTIAFVDGQNLFHNARNAFGYSYPNYDVQKLAQAVCATRGWKLERVQFYTGVPSVSDNSFWHGFWSNKLAIMGRRGVQVYSRPLVYRNKTIHVPSFGKYTFPSGEEKGIDVRLALDALDAAHRDQFDVALIFSKTSANWHRLCGLLPVFRSVGSRSPAPTSTALPPAIDEGLIVPIGVPSTKRPTMPASTYAIIALSRKCFWPIAKAKFSWLSALLRASTHECRVARTP
jgi:uncharacterized LabA/DUF88 family protein